MCCKTDVEKVKPPTKANTIAAKIPSIVIYSFSIFLAFLAALSIDLLLHRCLQQDEPLSHHWFQHLNFFD